MRVTSQMRAPEALKKSMTGKRLRAIREAYGLSASELSDMLGIERTYWSRWEHGRRPVPLDVAWKLTQMFEVDLDYILAGDVRSVPPAVQAKLRSPR